MIEIIRAFYYIWAYAALLCIRHLYIPFQYFVTVSIVMEPVLFHYLSCLL